MNIRIPIFLPPRSPMPCDRRRQLLTLICPLLARGLQIHSALTVAFAQPPQISESTAVPRTPQNLCQFLTVANFLHQPNIHLHQILYQQHAQHQSCNPPIATMAYERPNWAGGSEMPPHLPANKLVNIDVGEFIRTRDAVSLACALVELQRDLRDATRSRGVSLVCFTLLISSNSSRLPTWAFLHLSTAQSKPIWTIRRLYSVATLRSTSVTSCSPSTL